MPGVKHPAKFSASIMELLGDIVDPQWRILDPFAGTGRVHQLGELTVGVEIEPEWAAMHPRTVVGDATALPFPAASFDAVVTSPCYGNRMADHHEAKDASQRNTYRHVLGRPLSPGSAAAMQWGSEYRALHLAAWSEARRVLRPGGRIVVNVSDHIRKGQRMPVTEWHLHALDTLGLRMDATYLVPTQRQRQGANGHLRVEGESVLCGNKA